MKTKVFEWESNNIFKRQFYFFKDLINKSDPKILEIGSHWGQDTIRFCKIFNQLDIYCFEPCQDNCYIFNKNMSKIQELIPEFKGNISLIKKAVSNIDDKKVILYRPSRTAEKTQRLKAKKTSDPFHNMKQNGWIAGNLYLDKKDIRDYYFDLDGCSLNKINLKNQPIDQEIVHTISIDTWDKNQKNGFYDLAWIDTQGAEKQVLLGSKETLKKIKYVFIEHSQSNYENSMSRDETIRFMRLFGFNYFFDFDKDNLLFSKNRIF